MDPISEYITASQAMLDRIRELEAERSNWTLSLAESADLEVKIAAIEEEKAKLVEALHAKESLIKGFSDSINAKDARIQFLETTITTLKNNIIGFKDQIRIEREKLDKSEELRQIVVGRWDRANEEIGRIRGAFGSMKQQVDQIASLMDPIELKEATEAFNLNPLAKVFVPADLVGASAPAADPASDLAEQAEDPNVPAPDPAVLVADAAVPAPDPVVPASDPVVPAPDPVVPASDPVVPASDPDVLAVDPPIDGLPDSVRFSPIPRRSVDPIVDRGGSPGETVDPSPLVADSEGDTDWGPDPSELDRDPSYKLPEKVGSVSNPKIGRNVRLVVDRLAGHWSDPIPSTSTNARKDGWVEEDPHWRPPKIGPRLMAEQLRYFAKDGIRSAECPQCDRRYKVFPHEGRLKFTSLMRHIDEKHGGVPQILPILTESAKKPAKKSRKRKFVSSSDSE
ncbi:hypothetical protein HDE_01824 [Halotydeus destructor]|nr:hypothetical protein HDE_01824 [Halotydeus destructor]